MKKQRNSMKNLYFEIASAQLNKYNEELCGDSIMSHQGTNASTLILSDGLGSGVKANILATDRKSVV